MNKKPVMLMILDGWGIGNKYEGNAIHLADTPNFDRLAKENPYTEIKASGLSVGLPEGQMGNSEVGHLNIGAGRVVYQELTKISKAIEDGSFEKMEEFLAAIDNAKKNNSKLHIMGLLSDGGVHSHNNHLYAILELCRKENFEDVYIHAFLDGRDVGPTSGIKHIKELEEKINEIGLGKIASVSGRYYAMDRDNRWERTEAAYNAMLIGEGNRSESALSLVEKSYNEGIHDEFLVPTVITENNEAVATIDNEDSIIFFNFRPDRARQITRAIVDSDFQGFKRTKEVDTFYVTLTEYDKTIENVQVIFKPNRSENTLGEYISGLGKSQLRIAETEKYAHVTFFFNGGWEEAYEKEDRVLIPSPNVATYDLKPEMSAIEIKDEVINRINSGKYDLIVLNFANADMLGHTGKIDATIKGVETVDQALGEITDLLKEKGGKALITADHGNAELLVDKEDGSPITAHSINPVPLILLGEDNVELKEGILADIAPSLLDMVNLEKPKEMTGKSLIVRKQ